jgi:hypothetical protein
VIVTQRAHAHDLYIAVDSDGKISLNAENDVQPFGILRVELYAINAAYLGPSRVAHRGTGLKSAGEGKIRVKLYCRSSKSTAYAEHGGKQHRHGDEYE